MRAQEFQPKKLVIFDIDDTLVHTQTKVNVVKDGQVTKELNSHDFTHYKLQPGEQFDFENFRNAHDFFHNSKPIIPMMDQLKNDIATGNKVVMVTARADFDDRELFLDTFRKYGVDIDRVHVYRAGNMTGKMQTEEKKKIIIRNLLDKGNYTKAIMYDDAVPNLDSFVELKDEYPRTKFYAWHVSLEGEASEYHRTNESQSLEERKKKRKPRRAAYGPGLYGGYGYFSTYGNSDSGSDTGGGDGGESIKNENFVTEDAMMGKLEDSGKIVRILKKAHTVPFSDEKNWLLVDMDPAKGNKGLGIKWIPADTRFEWVRPYRDTVDENIDNDAAREYRAHLIKTLPQIMKLFANIGKGWIPSKEQMLSAVDTAYRVMKHTGDAKQAGKVLMDELNALYRMSQGKKGIDELFDGGKDWKWTYQDKNQAMAAFTVGDVNYTFSAGQDPDEAPGDWDVEFAAKKEAGTASWGVTGTGNSAQVFGTVVEIMKAFITSKKASIRRMTFAAKEDSRQGLYARMVKRLLPKWNLEQNGEAFVLTRPGGLVFWVYSVEAPYNKIPAVKVKANSAQEAEQMVLTTMPEFKGADRMGMGASKNKPNLGESRSNPDQNPKPESGMKELVAVAKTIADPENWAVSMTGEAKLGINPQVGISEDTPKGIYFYPLDYAVDLARRGKKLPWGDNMPYIQLFQYDRSGEMTKETQVDPTRLTQALGQYCPAEVIQQAIDEPEYDGTPYWTIYDCLSRLGKSDETNVVRWNKVLRDLGFTSVFDNGAGWIAYNEPTQGVVLDPRVIKQHKTIVNKQQSRVVTPAVIERAIFDTLDMELAANRAWQKYDPDGTKLRTAAKEYAKKPEFKQWFGKPATEEIFDKAASWGRYGARELSQEAWEWFKAQQAQNVAENFADGKNPQDKGDAKRHGVNTKASVSSLRKTAKQGGRKGQLAHWMANMKAGKKK